MQFYDKVGYISYQLHFELFSTIRKNLGLAAVSTK